jgi:hypothetical protein
MSKVLKTYDPARIAIIIGPHKIEGTAPGKRVKIEHPEKYNMVEGTDGEVARGKTNFSSITVTVELLQTSESNDVLSGFFKTDDNTPGGVPLPLMVKDLDGSSLWLAAGSWATKLPDVEYTDTVGSSVWVFKTGPAESFVGGKVSAV